FIRHHKISHFFPYTTLFRSQLEKTTQQLCKRLLRGSINSYRAIKEMSWKASFEDWQDYTALELQLQEDLAFKEDFKEGVLAFSEDRKSTRLNSSHVSISYAV